MQMVQYKEFRVPFIDFLHSMNAFGLDEIEEHLYKMLLHIAQDDTKPLNQYEILNFSLIQSTFQI